MAIASMLAFDDMNNAISVQPREGATETDQASPEAPSTTGQLQRLLGQERIILVRSGRPSPQPGGSSGNQDDPQEWRIIREAVRIGWGNGGWNDAGLKTLDMFEKAVEKVQPKTRSPEQDWVLF